MNDGRARAEAWKRGFGIGCVARGKRGLAQRSLFPSLAMKTPFSRTKTRFLLLFVLVLLTPFDAFVQADTKDAKTEAERLFQKVKGKAEEGDGSAQYTAGRCYDVVHGNLKDQADLIGRAAL